MRRDQYKKDTRIQIYYVEGKKERKSETERPVSGRRRKGWKDEEKEERKMKMDYMRAMEKVKERKLKRGEETKQNKSVVQKEREAVFSQQI